MKKHFNYFMEGWAMISMICFPAIMLTIPFNKLYLLVAACVLGYAIGWAIEFTRKQTSNDGRGNI